MGIEHTSVPQWDATVPAWPAAARSCTIVGIGPESGAAALSWEAEARSGGASVRLLQAETAEAVLQELGEELQRAVVGWRLLVAGPEAEVLLVRSRALHLGAVGSEVLTFVTDTRLRRVLCAHCDTVTAAEVAVGASCTCTGCCRVLHVYHHVSRRLAAYLGYLRDAEDAEPTSRWATT